MERITQGNRKVEKNPRGVLTTRMRKLWCSVWEPKMNIIVRLICHQSKVWRSWRRHSKSRSNAVVMKSSGFVIK
jgi:hypothetical protein